MKKLNLLFTFLLTISLTVSLIGCSNERPLAPRDDFGGGGNGGDVTDYSDEVASEYLIDEIICDDITSDGTYDEEANDCYKINLNELSTVDLSNVTAYAYKNNELKIKDGGVFVLSGDLSGTITVNDTEDRIQIVLNGVDVHTTAEQDCAALVFKKPEGETVGERILTINENTINILSDSVGDTADGDGAVIQAKKRSLAINGKGTLKLNCYGEKTSGLKVKTSLVIDGPTIEVNNAVKSGIKADRQIVVRNANIKINSDGDGIKTDMEPTTEEEAKEYADNAKYGYIYIENSNFDIMVGDDGFSANNCIYIANTSSNVIKIETNGGAPSSITEYSSDNADVKAIKVEG